MNKQYRVTGPRRVSGVSRGSVVTLDDKQVNVPALIEAGHVELMKTKTKIGESEDKEDSE
jgi:hypothetical protein